MALNDRQLDVVNFVEQKFWEDGFIPSYEKVAEVLKEKVGYVRDCVEKSTDCRKALVARGVDVRPSEAANLLTSQQLMAANLILNTHDKRTQREKLDFLGISSQQWHAWLRQPGFSQYMTKRSEEMFGANDFSAYQALQEAVEEGDMNAVKFHFEMRGKYKNRVEVDLNIDSVVTNIVEIISTHVHDPDTLLAIANDIQNKVLPELSKDAGQHVTVEEVVREDSVLQRAGSL